LFADISGLKSTQRMGIPQSMIDQILTALVAWIVGIISSTGYLGLVVLMAIESACIPLPSEIIMPFAGYLVSVGQFSLIGAATMGALGCNLGSTVAYYVAASGGRSAIERWGVYLLISPRDLRRAEQFFDRYGSVTVFIGRLLPVVRTFIAFPAGLARMPMAKFQIYTFLGSWPWCFGLAYIGYVLGDRWNSGPTLRKLFHQFDAVIVALIMAGFAGFVWARWRERVQPKH
jgi:membrane protein DedA with SNARE-associated domain